MSTENLAVSKYASARGGGWIQRYSFVERVNHWIGGAAYLYLLLTGLAFWSPYLYWMAAPGRGRTHRTFLASLGRTHFHRFGIYDVRSLERRHAQDGRRPRLVECDWTLHPE